jgi:hypothetical protein
MVEKSLCETCFNMRKRRWWREADPETIMTQVRCSVTAPYNVTYHVVLECNQYTEKKLTRQEFEDEGKK